LGAVAFSQYAEGKLAHPLEALTAALMGRNSNPVASSLVTDLARDPRALGLFP
jgi:hypothetical protein